MRMRRLTAMEVTAVQMMSTLGHKRRRKNTGESSMTSLFKFK